MVAMSVFIKPIAAMRKNFISVHLAKVFIYMSLFLFCCFSNHIQAQKYSLKNDQIDLFFNEQGIQSLSDKHLGKSFSFSSDSFLIAINGNVYTKNNTKFNGITEASGILTYTYVVPGFTFKVIYSLKEGWFFLSKQLEIYPDKNETFRVDDLKVLDMELSEKTSSFYIPRTKHPELKTNDYGIYLRFADATGLLMTVQNPFLQCTINEQKIGLEYKPEMNWKKEYGVFQSDIGNIGAYMLTGNRIPAKMIPEWKWTKGIVAVTDQEQDQAEVEAFTKIVEKYVLTHPAKSIKLNVGWCENDYQIDISNAAGREEYKRIINQTAAMGMDHILFTPSNAALGSRDSATDDWGWENLLWLGLGIQIRKGEWNVEKDPIPASLQEMLDYAKSKHVQLISYLYPVLPFAGNAEWIVEGSLYHQKKKHASLGVRSLQDYLIKTLSRFYERTGISGYSYDYTYLWYEGTSRYEQWRGWCRVKETLRKKYPEIIIDGRQLDQLYGPWTWVSGSFPHPTAEDEQPESFIPFPDLHFDRVSANRQRYTAYRYRVNDYCPPVIMPGFMFHQTPRNDVREGKVFLPLEGFRRCDWDYLGWKYSLFSSIATGGLNNVVNMIPARDLEEMKHFSAADKKFVRDWLNWTDSKRDYLLQTKFILGQPAFGKVDGTAAIKDDNGFVFLFNPNARRLSAELFLDASIGLTKPGDYQIKVLYPTEGKQISPEGNSLYWKQGDLFRIDLDGASNIVLEITAASETITEPRLFNMQGKPRIARTALYLEQVAGEMGTTVNWKAALTNEKKLDKVYINGKQVSFFQQGKVVTGNVKFAGKSFSPMQQVGQFDQNFAGGTYAASFNFPKWVTEQLKERKQKWPIPWTKEDYKTTWLVPERLLLFVQIAEPEDTMAVKLKLNGKQAELTKAYSSVRTNKRSFVGWYCDVSDYAPDTVHSLELSLPALKPGQFQGVFFENIETKFTNIFTEENKK